MVLKAGDGLVACLREIAGAKKYILLHLPAADLVAAELSRICDAREIDTLILYRYGLYFLLHAGTNCCHGHKDNK